jgi:hypothetical protein
LHSLAAAGTGSVTLILDDYHVITNRAVHEALSYLLERTPPSLRIVIASREDPPLPLPRLRARDELDEIRVADLRFTADEARAFLAGALTTALSDDDTERLRERTRDGRRRCTSTRCPCAPAATRGHSSTRSPAMTATSLTTSPARCWRVWMPRSAHS